VHDTSVGKGMIVRLPRMKQAEIRKLIGHLVMMMLSKVAEEVGLRPPYPLCPGARSSSFCLCLAVWELMRPT